MRRLILAIGFTTSIASSMACSSAPNGAKPPNPLQYPPREGDLGPPLGEERAADAEKRDAVKDAAEEAKPTNPPASAPTPTKEPPPPPPPPPPPK